LHGIFSQEPHNHINGSGCPTCGNISKSRKNSTYSYGSYQDKPTALYYIKITKNNNIVYKIGITTKIQNILNRFEKNINIDIINIRYFLTGSYAYKKEQEILEKFYNFKYKGEPILRTGNTELFYKDINPNLFS